MAHARRLRFATQLNEPLPGLSWLDSAREVEQLGYSTLFVPDHFDEGPGPIASIAAFAAVTTTLNVGVLVLDCDFRHPVPLAAELATIDQMSEGRLEVGLGAGWKATDYQKSGIPMDKAGVRVTRLQEHTAVLKGLWGEGPFSFRGDNYTITDLDGMPKPFKPDGPPILVGGGAPRLLRWAGATADIVGVNASIHSGEIDLDAAQDAMAARIDEKVAWVKEGAGDRFDDLELNAWLAVAELTEDQGLIELYAGGFGTTPDELRRSPLALVGAQSEIRDILTDRRDRWGYSYHVIPGDKAHAFAPLVAELTGT